MIDIDSLTVKQIREISALCAGNKNQKPPLVNVGQKVFIRTITHHYTGEVTIVCDDWIELKNAAWIADDGRFNNFLKTGEANEVEPYVNPVRILIGTILDVTEWQHALPRDVK